LQGFLEKYSNSKFSRFEVIKKLKFEVKELISNCSRGLVKKN